MNIIAIGLFLQAAQGACLTAATNSRNAPIAWFQDQGLGQHLIDTLVRLATLVGLRVQHADEVLRQRGSA